MKKLHYCCDAAATRAVTKLDLSNGFQAGIFNLDLILNQVADLGLVDEQALKKELLARVRENNYIAPSAEGVYGAALVDAYRLKIEMG